ncbi:MAG: hypothetical protein HFG51_04875 [Lachnospiraceae bacterium]|nr:hypothetical protein [Lachnospiraceae bacterium]
MLPLSTTPQTRSRYWDIVRGIGILSIVMGHCFSHAVIYVYTYHLAIFFFVSGFLYNEKRYGQDPFAHIGAKLKSSWPNYMLYMSLFVLLHNPFQIMGINAPAQHYTPSQTLAHLGNSLVFYGAEPMGGALWFVPVWVLACGIFGGIAWFSLRFSRPFLILIPVSLMLSCVGAFLMFREVFLFYRVHLVFLVQPFFAAGWLLKTKLPQFRRFLAWYIALPCALFLGFLVNAWQLHIDIAVGRIGNGWQFFFLAFLGIYCCMTLADLLDKIDGLGRLFALWGRYSFDIMALHFLIFKLMDVSYGRLYHHPLEYYSAFPHAFGGILWPVYVLLGTTFPALLGYGLERLKKASLA